MRTAASVISPARVACRVLWWYSNKVERGSTENTAVSRHRGCSGSISPAGLSALRHWMSVQWQYMKT